MHENALNETALEVPKSPWTQMGFCEAPPEVKALLCFLDQDGGLQELCKIATDVDAQEYSASPFL